MNLRKNSEIPRLDWILFAVFILLNAIDAAETIVASRHPFFYELNPIMRWALSHGNVFFAMFKMGISLTISYTILRLDIPHRYSRLLLFASALIGLVVIWNIVIYALFASNV